MGSEPDIDVNLDESAPREKQDPEHESSRLSAPLAEHGQRRMLQ